MGKSESMGYITPYKRALVDTNFPNNFDARLVSCQSDLKDCLQELKNAKKIALDTETNSTDWNYGHIVGMSCSTDKDSGWYIPFRHEEYSRNLPLALFPKIFNLIMDKQILMYNALFDETMFNKEGWDCSKLKIRDVMGLVYLMDTNIHLPSLKDSELFFLGRRAPTFEETLKGREHFGWIPPEEAVRYASIDTGSTFGLDELLYPIVNKEAPTVLKLDTAFIPVLLQLCSTKLPVRSEILNSLESYYIDEMTLREKKIFKAVGYPFNIRSNKDLTVAFKQLGIKTGYTTDKGNMSLKAEVLELIQDKYPFVKDIVKYKSMSSTLSALKKFRGKEWIRCNYEMYNTVTGRMSSGSAKSEGKLNLPKGVRPYFDAFNAQNFLKAKEILYKGIYKPDDPYSILGYRFRPIDKSEVQPDDLIVECMDYKGNPRRLINCCKKDEEGNIIFDEKTHYWVKADYAGAELRLATLFSKEPVLLEAFLKGIDPHTNTAKMMFNLTDKAHRGKAKTCLGEHILVRTNNGLKYPKDLLPNDKLLDYNGNYIDYLINTEDNCDMIKVEWSNGIIEEYSADHKVAVWTGKNVEYKCILDITSSDQVVGIGKQEQWETKPYVWEAKDWYSSESNSKHKNLKIDISNNYFAYLIGLYLGDGNVDRYETNRYIRILINNEDVEYHKRNLEQYKIPSSISPHHQSKKVSLIRISVSGLADWFIKNFGRISEEKFITPEIYKWFNRGQLTYLLAGLIDSDGTYKGNRTAFINSNSRLVSDVAQLAAILGIQCKKYVNRTGITTEEGRTYKNKQGEDLKDTINLIFLDMNGVDLPIRRFYKKSTNVKCEEGWYFDKSIIPSNKYAKLIRGNRKLSCRLTNIRKGNRCTRETFKWIQKVNPEFINETRLTADMQPIKLVNKSIYKGRKYIISVNTREHEYQTGTNICLNCNFSLLYEGSPDSLTRNSGLPYEEAEELWHKYWDTMKVLKSWKIQEQRKANISCVCKTFMGRPRRLHWYFRHPKLSMRSFAKRSVISHMIQGSLGDIIKLTLINSHKKIFNNPSWTENNDATFYMTIHDEIDAAVRKERLEEYLDTLLTLGKIQIPGWEFPLELDCDLGYSYGFVVPIKKDKETGKWKVKFKKGSDIIG